MYIQTTTFLLKFPFSLQHTFKLLKAFVDCQFWKVTESFGCHGSVLLLKHTDIQLESHLQYQ